MPLTSLAMIVKNEEAGLAGCLESVRALTQVTEVVVVDTGSTDRTPEIAREHGARVFHEPWRHDFAWHRNHAQSLCTNPWILVLDGDEVLADPGDLDRLLAAPAAPGIACRVDCVGAAGDLEESHVALRAYDRSLGSWAGRVHNQCHGIPEMDLSTAVVTAFYDEDIVETTRRRMETLLASAAEDPEDSHAPLFLAKGYRVLGEPEEVVRWGNRFFDTGGPGHPQAPAVAAWMVQAWLALGNEADAFKLLQLSLGRWAGSPDLHHLHLTMVARQWYASVRDTPLAYLTVPQSSPRFARDFPEAAALLGLPISFGAGAAAAAPARPRLRGETR